MAECVILIGLPGAGKTTFYRQRLSNTHVHISKDRLPPSARDKQSRQDAAIRAALDAGQSLAVDNTNVSAAERAAIIAIARAHAAKVIGAYVVASTREAVPGFSLPAVFSNCVSTHTSPTPGTAGVSSGLSGRSLP